MQKINNEKKEKKQAYNGDIEKLKVDDMGKIEKTIGELSFLIRQGKIGIVNIQRAMRCGFPTAVKIYDLIKGNDNNGESK